MTSSRSHRAFYFAAFLLGALLALLLARPARAAGSIVSVKAQHAIAAGNDVGPAAVTVD